MRYTASIAFLLSLLLATPALASGTRSRRAHKDLYVREHLAVPSATVCTDTDGDNTTDANLMDGDVCVDTDDETFCYYLDDTLHCIYASVAPYQREQVNLFDDFIEMPNVYIDDHLPYDNYLFEDPAGIGWVYFLGASSNNPGLSNKLEAYNEQNMVSPGRIGILYAYHDGDCWWGVRSPTDPEDGHFRFTLDNLHGTLDLRWSMKVTATANYITEFGLTTDLMRAQANNRYAVFAFRNSEGSYAGQLYGWIRCEGGYGNPDDKKVRFSNTWAVDTDWHTYRIYVVPTTSGNEVDIYFYQDGTLVGTCDENSVNQSASYMWLVEGTDTGNTSSHVGILIDYVQAIITPYDSSARKE